jgi:hypothetical protein
VGRAPRKAEKYRRGGIKLRQPPKIGWPWPFIRSGQDIFSRSCRMPHTH